MNEIKLKIGKEEYGFKFTVITLEMFCEKAGIEYHEMFEYIEGNPFGIWREVFQAANAVYNKSDVCTLDKWDVDDLIDQMTAEQYKQLKDAFNDMLSRMLDKLKQFKPSEDSPKKK